MNISEFGARDGENKSLLETLLTEIVGDLRLIDGRQPKTSFVRCTKCQK